MAGLSTNKIPCLDSVVDRIATGDASPTRGSPGDGGVTG
jgi:hypothetical protein